MNNTHEKITKARAQMVQSARFFGFLALRLEPAASPRTETVATDGRSLFYNPAWVDAAPLDEVTGVVAKMALHTALLHHTRRRGRDEQRWKEACDYATTALLRQAGFALPATALDNPAWAGKSAEDIYRLLPEPPEPEQGSGKGAGADGAGGEGDGEPEQGDGTQGPESEESGPDEDDEPGDNPGDSGDNPDLDEGEGQPDPAGCGQVLDAIDENGGDPSPASLAEIENMTQVAVAQAANLARAAGQGSSDQERLVKDAKEAQVDWAEELRRFAQQHSKDDYDWSRPNRRLVSSGLYMPRLRSEQMGAMVLALDASGSTLAWLDRFCREMRGIVEDLRPKKVYVLWATDVVVHVDEFEPDEWPDKLTGHGLGGTDFRPAVAWADKLAANGEEVACMVYLTDLYGPAPERAPDYPFLWACCTSEKAPWGDTVRLKG